jgi:hypothetical protein
MLRAMTGSLCDVCGKPQWKVPGSGVTCENGHGFGDPDAAPPKSKAPKEPRVEVQDVDMSDFDAGLEDVSSRAAAPVRSAAAPRPAEPAPQAAPSPAEPAPQAAPSPREEFPGMVAQSDDTVYRFVLRSEMTEYTARRLHAICILAEGRTPIRVMLNGKILIPEDRSPRVDPTEFAVLARLFGIG